MSSMQVGVATSLLAAARIGSKGLHDLQNSVSHQGFPFFGAAAKPSCTRRRIASERGGLSFLDFSPASTAARNSDEKRMALTGARLSTPVNGRPRLFFGTTPFFLAFTMELGSTNKTGRPQALVLCADATYRRRHAGRHLTAAVAISNVLHVSVFR